MSCNEVVIDSATYMLKISSSLMSALLYIAETYTMC